MLEEEFPAAEIAETADSDDLLNLVRKEHWDVVISDISMPGRGGLEVLQQIRQQFPKLPVLILSIHPEDQYAIRVLRAGASGYLSKESAQGEVVAAVHKVLMGKKHITPALAEKLVESLDRDPEKLPHEFLSDREFEVFKLLAGGKSVSEIGEQLSLSSTTISTYRSRVLTKMTMKTNADLTLYAVENSLLVKH
jgi:two-component system invasion response regulator UvrY